MVEPYILITDLKAFRTKHIYDQLLRVNYILFFLLHLLFKTVIGDFSNRFESKLYYYRCKFYYIFYFFTYNIFSILKSISNIYKLTIRGLFINEYCT